MQIQINNNDILEQELNLDPGTYTLGRSTKADIVLAGNRISRKHAKLIIDVNGWQVEDLGSANGTFVDGKQIKKRKKLKSKSSLAIGCFTLFAKLEKTSGKPQKSKKIPLKSFFSFGASKPYLAGTLFLLFCCLGTVFWLGMVNKSYLSSIVYENEVERALSISANLVHHNQNNWDQSDVSQLEISFFEQQPGVVHVFLVDQHGRIFAPIDQVNHILRYPLVAKALSSGKTEQEIMESGDLLICSPVKSRGEIVGVAVVQYQMRGSVSLLRDRFWQFSVGFVFLLAMSAGLAFVLVKMIIEPWTALSKCLEQTIGTNKTMLDYNAAYQELDHLRIQIDRLLLKKENPGLSSQLAEANFATKSDSMPDVKEVFTTDTSPELDENEKRAGMIICLIDSDSSLIVDSSEKFRKLFHLTESTGQHILEVFQDPLLLPEIMNLLQKQVTKSTLAIEGKMFLITGEVMTESPSHLLIRFEQNND